MHSLRFSSLWNLGFNFVLAISVFGNYVVPSAAYETGAAPVRIDCGNTQNSDDLGLRWIADTGFTGGVTHNVTSLQSILTNVDQSLRQFQPLDQPCYQLSVPIGRYLVRLSFAYDSFDGLNQPPTFSVHINGILVEIIDMQQQVTVLAGAPYNSDYIVYVKDSNISVCFETILGLPIVNSLQILPQDTDEYEASKLGTDIILSTYARINSGGPGFGPEPADQAYRTWTADIAGPDGNYTELNTTQSIAGVDKAPDRLPEMLFQTAREASQSLNFTGYEWAVSPVDPSNSWLMRFHFAEINPAVKVGERLTDIIIGNEGLVNFDILKGPGGNATISNFTAVTVPIEVNFTSLGQGGATLDDVLIIFLKANGSLYQPLLSGIELYEIISTVPPPLPPIESPLAGPAVEGSTEGGGDPYTTTEKGPLKTQISKGFIAAIVFLVFTFLVGTAILIAILVSKKAAARAQANRVNLGQPLPPPPPTPSPPTNSMATLLSRFGSRAPGRQVQEELGSDRASLRTAYEKATGGTFNSGIEMGNAPHPH